MMDLVKKMLGIQADGQSAPDARTRQRKPLVATCALLLEIAHIDGRISVEEWEKIVSIMEHEYGLEEAEAAAILETSRAELKQSIDLWQFTSVINRHFSEEEKVQVVEMVWKVIFADGKLDKYEDYLVHTLAGLLHLEHGQLIESKLKARNAGKAT